MSKYITEDVERLASFMRRSKDDNQPFALLTGAGCSVSAGIPTANSLLEEICEGSNYEPQISKLSEDDRKNYGKVMAHLSRNDR